MRVAAPAVALLLLHRRWGGGTRKHKREFGRKGGGAGRRRHEHTAVARGQGEGRERGGARAHGVSEALFHEGGKGWRGGTRSHLVCWVGAFETAQGRGARPHRPRAVVGGADGEGRGGLLPVPTSAHSPRTLARDPSATGIRPPDPTLPPTQSGRRPPLWMFFHSPQGRSGFHTTRGTSHLAWCSRIHPAGEGREAWGCWGGRGGGGRPRA